MPSPAIETPGLAPDEPPAAAGWTECPRCGEPWVADSPYCTNCGWVPEPANAADVAAPGALDARVVPAVALGLGGLALAAMAWGWLGLQGDAPAPRPAPKPAPMPTLAAALPAAASMPAAPPVPASQPMPMPVPVPVPMPVADAAAPPVASAPTPAPAPAPAPAVPPVRHATAPAPVATPVAALSAARSAAGASATSVAEAAATVNAERFAREWLAAESAQDAADAALARSRPLYAERVDYRGQAGADWALILADKTEFARRWPKRQYQLLAVQEARVDAQGRLDTRLQLRWRLENQGRWREGTSTAVLRLQRIDGQWRIVAESGA
ncbi:hypothetical protein AACH10_18395 [Ideonella sp. DXS22W]|uniref:DUF4440 domain-containing protein n=1 Tax=Pseudaquabacterium inlustre TaxID=2984192 RepID=A0ABU9CK55_9BURK